MKIQHWLSASLALLAGALYAEVPELTALVPEATGYQLVAKLDPTTWNTKKYQVDNSATLDREVKRVGYLLKLTDNDDKSTWVFVSMDAFSPDLKLALVPADPKGYFYQDYVANLEVFSNVEGVKTGKFAKGNAEFWGANYGGGNAKNIPGATGKYDFGDQKSDDGNYGSMQIHNYLEKQTVFAFNRFTAGKGCDLGIGNSTGANPDWTFAGNGKNYKSAELFIVAEFGEKKAELPFDAKKVLVTGATDKPPVSYKAGEPMVFTLNVDFKGQELKEEYFLIWTRTGDDGKTENGKEKVADGSKVTIKTSIDKPGFVRILARVVDAKDKEILDSAAIRSKPTSRFEGGAGAEIDKLESSPEPADFDAFWVKQKERLAQVPMKADLQKHKNSNDKVTVYMVSIDCAGPRPVTGFLTVPVNAKEKSLPAVVSYHGYGVRKQNAPGAGTTNQITFSVNAHGYQLEQPDAFYAEFSKSIQSNGNSYAFDAKENEDPEKAYFNHMALRLMRSLEYVKSMPEWDGKSLIASGGSQGGLQAIWAAALDQDVTRCDSNVTWCCDLAGASKMGRLSAGWRVPYTPSIDYYDAVNHAKRIKCPVDITRAGLGDYTCPPSGLAVLYNNIKSPKKINWVQGSNHGYVPPKAQTQVIEQK